MNKILISVFVILLGCSPLVAGINQATPKYEYLVVPCRLLCIPAKGQTKKINKYAREGWEFIDVVYAEVVYWFYFKREVTE